VPRVASSATVLVAGWLATGALMSGALMAGALVLPAPLAGQSQGQSPSTAPSAWSSSDIPVLTTFREAPEASGIIEMQRLSGPVTLDGIVDEAAWAGIEPLPLVMYEPAFRGASDRRIQILVGYDDEALYVAGRFLHDDPSDIRALSLTRDRWSGDDGYAILLDTFNDKENAVRFVALPLGTRMDMSITGDGQDEGGQAGGPRGVSWNSFWDLETRITDEGWFGEMRIPFSSLRFETEPDGSVVMGMMVYAYEPARGERWTFPAIPSTAPYTQVSAWQEIRFDGVAPTNPVYFSPYALVGGASSAVLNEERTAFGTESSQEVQFGGDLKFNPTPNLTLDLTVNTDFAAVEADQQQVNLTRFSLFFDEKRPFFQERAGIFAFETGADRGTLFYSRRIGLAGGQPIGILGGARLVGRVGNWDVGLIAMQTEEDRGIASENFGVLRLRRRVMNPNSFIGGMATSRVDTEGEYNVTYGIDGQFRLFGDEYLTVKWLQTVQGGDPLRDAAPKGLDGGRVVVDWTRRRLQGFSYQNVFVWSGPGYDPGVGFELRQDFTRGQSDWNMQWFPGEESRLRRIWLGMESNAWVRNADEEVDTGQIRPFLTLETNPGLTLTLASNSLYEDVPEGFALSDEALIPAGSYWATEGSVEIRAPRGWTVRPNLTTTVGQFFDGHRVSLDGRLNWAASRYVEFIGGWDWNRIRFDNRGQAFDANLLRLTARGAVNTRISIDTFLQYNSLDDRLTTNARFRYNFREGQDLWLVWNEGLNLDRTVLGLPRLPLQEARTLTMKYTHTLVF
jgi:hypothetical protein